MGVASASTAHSICTVQGGDRQRATHRNRTESGMQKRNAKEECKRGDAAVLSAVHAYLSFLDSSSLLSSSPVWSYTAGNPNHYGPGAPCW